MSERRSFRFPRTADAVGAAQEVAVAAVPGGLSPREAAGLRDLVSELMSGAVADGGAAGDIRMDVTRTDGTVRVEVSDTRGGPVVWLELRAAG